MAEYTAAFDVTEAQAGALNIWTRSGLEVKFGGYNASATDPNEAVQVWINNVSADYPVDGRANGMTDDPLDLLMVTEDVEKWTNVYLIEGVYDTYLEPLYDTEIAANAVGSLLPNYFASCAVTIILPKNI